MNAETTRCLPEGEEIQCQTIALHIDYHESRNIKEGLKLLIKKSMMDKTIEVDKWLEDPNIHNKPNVDSLNLDNLISMYLSVTTLINYHFE